MSAWNRQAPIAWPTLVDLLQDRAMQQGAQRSLGFLLDAAGREDWRTFAQLDEQARAIAVQLQEAGFAGQNALLFYPPGLDFITALLGCFYAGVAAVPVHLPRPNRPLTRLESIVADARVTLALTTQALLPELKQRCHAHRLLETIAWQTTDGIDPQGAAAWTRPALRSDTVACLQYTSGSTSTPKGVVLTHANLLWNSRLIYDAFHHDDQSRGLIWLPPYHDMGLIGGILQPLYGGFPTLLMSPLHVVQRPLRWLQAISRFRATTSGGPNFIYDACVDRIPEADCGALDLSTWHVAFNGAEPIRPDTLERFAAKFAPYGFRREAFFACYGLAEATLFVSGGPRGVVPETRVVSRSGLERHRVAAPQGADDMARIASCGPPAAGLDVQIVDPESRVPCGEGCVGEIWVHGPSVAAGYWQRPDNREVFAAELAAPVPRGYMRTGDLGFFADGHLFVTGRLKELLILDGRNYYPQDIEWTVEQCHPAMRTHSGAVFTVGEDDEQLIVVHEVEHNGRGHDPADMLAEIRRAVGEEHELGPAAIVLVKAGGVPKTPSGKIQRRLCRTLYLTGQLPVVAQWPSSGVVTGRVPAAAGTHAPSVERSVQATDAARESVERLTAWLIARVAKQIGCPAGDIDIRRPLAAYGLKSRDAIELTGDLERHLGRRLAPTLVYQHPTIQEVAAFLTQQPLAAEGDAAALCGAGDAYEPIAIVGIGCRLPGAADPQAFWKLLVEGRDAVTPVPADRWDVDAAERLAAQAVEGYVPGTLRWGGWLSDIDGFDPAFFGIAPREAACIDPQQRLLLEVAWEALEDGGGPCHRLRGSRTGVFVGISTNDYRRNVMFRTTELDPYWTTGNAGSVAANRLSYCFDFHGPSVAVDTACSSSLVAVHWACRSLRSGECEAALAGGVNLILTPDISFSFLKAGGLAPDGRCKAFDAAANGIVRSEGAGFVVLKRLSAARAAGDRVYAVIRGSAVNQDGRSNGITAPSQAAQEAVLEQAWNSAGLPPGKAQYIETHGAGTLLGDVIEAHALQRVLGADRPAGRRCRIGSVKTNIGHCESAAGIAGLIKVALAMHHGRIPPNLHFQAANPHLRFDEMPFDVQTALTDWPEPEGARVAGVSSFGFGGTNVHLVLASQPGAVSYDTAPAPAASHLVPLSAASSPALAESAQRLAEHLAANPPADAAALADVACELALHRSHLDYRAVAHVRGSEDLAKQIAALREGKGHPRLTVGKIAAGAPRVTFVFSGHGGQWPAMQQALCGRFPAAATKLAECQDLLRRHADWRLLDELQAPPPHSRLQGTHVEIAQTCLFAVQVALAEACKACGIVPDAVVGHSVGEIAAAHVAGILTLDDALRIVVQRSRLLEQALREIPAGGAMAALRISADDARALLVGLEDRVWVAVHNSPCYTVLSGDKAVLEELIARTRDQKLGARLMQVPGAAHTPLLEPTRLKLQAALAGLQPRVARVPFYSTVTGARHDEPLDAAYWGANVRSEVRFAPAVERLLSDGFHAFLEIGPHPLLAAAITQCADHAHAEALVLPALRRDDHDLEAITGSSGALHVHGYPIDWRQFHPAPRPRVDLPTYPWQRQRCWIAPAVDPLATAAHGVLPGADPGSGMHPLLGAKREVAAQPDWLCWELHIDPRTAGTVFGYRAASDSPLPAAAFFEAAIAAGKEAFHNDTCVLDQVRMEEPLLLRGDGATRVQCVLQPHDAATAQFRVFSRAATAAGRAWRLHASCRVTCAPLPNETPEAGQPAPGVFADLQEHGQRCLIPPNGHGSAAVTNLWAAEKQALGQVQMLCGNGSAGPRDAAHPGFIDVCCGVLAAASGSALRADETYGVSTAARFYWHKPPRAGANLWALAVCDAEVNNGHTTVRGQVRVWDEQHDLVFAARDVALHRFARRTVSPGGSPVAVVPAETTAEDVLQALRGDSREQRLAAVQDFLRRQIARTLNTDPAAIDPQRPVTALGIDSLMAIEIRSRVEAVLGVELHMVQLLEGPTLAGLAETLLEQLDAQAAAPPACDPPAQGDVSSAEASKLLGQLDGLSDKEIEGLLNRMLAQ